MYLPSICFDIWKTSFCSSKFLLSNCSEFSFSGTSIPSSLVLGWVSIFWTGVSLSWFICLFDFSPRNHIKIISSKYFCKTSCKYKFYSIIHQSDLRFSVSGLSHLENADFSSEFSFWIFMYFLLFPWLLLSSSSNSKLTYKIDMPHRFLWLFLSLWLWCG